MSAAPIIRARGLHHSFGAVDALRGIDVDLYAGEALAIMGPSGSGKSTMLHVLAGVISPDRGQVFFDDRLISDLPESMRSGVRLRNFGFVFQFGQLLPDLTGVDNVSIPLLLAGTPRRAALTTAHEKLERLGVDHLAAKYPGEMSGGEAQRIAVARALVSRPRVLFADEPTGALDSLSAEQVMNELTALAEEEGTTLVIVTHDPRTAAYAQREVIVRDGRVTAGAMETAP